MEALHIWHSHAYNLEKNLFVTPDGKVVDVDTVKSILTKCSHVIDSKMTNAKLLQSLHLTYEETVVLGALAFLSPGRRVKTTCSFI